MGGRAIHAVKGRISLPMFDLSDPSTWPNAGASSAAVCVPTFCEEWDRVQREAAAAAPKVVKLQAAPEFAPSKPSKQTLPFSQRANATPQYPHIISEPLAAFISRPAPAWTIKAIIPRRGSLVLVYGETGSAKTFLGMMTAGKNALQDDSHDIQYFL